MSRWKTSILLLILVSVSLGETGTPLANPEVRRLGEQLICLCGCGSSVTSCQMLHCHFSDPARQKLMTLVSEGKSDSEILDSFVKEHGLRVLQKPPSDGFFLVGWVMPFAAVGFGLMVIWLFLRRFVRTAAATPAPAGGGEDLARYRDQIEKDLAKLE